jgi:hypothetical protein
LIGTFVTVDGSGNLSGSVMGTTASGYVVAQDGSGTFEAKISGDDLSLRLRFRTYLGQEGDIPLRLRRQ